jgi:hypothetical protein
VLLGGRSPRRLEFVPPISTLAPRIALKVEPPGGRQVGAAEGPDHLRRNMSTLLCGVCGGQQLLARLNDDIVWDATDSDELAAGASECARELCCPDVLPEEHRRRRARLELGSSVHQVLLAEKPGRFQAERLEAAPDVLVDVAQLESCDRTVRVLAHERQVDDPDRVRLDELRKSRRDLACEPVARERHDHVLDWPDLRHLSSFSLPAGGRVSFFESFTQVMVDDVRTGREAPEALERLLVELGREESVEQGRALGFVLSWLVSRHLLEEMREREAVDTLFDQLIEEYVEHGGSLDPVDVHAAISEAAEFLGIDESRLTFLVRQMLVLFDRGSKRDDAEPL